jgi:hypothetical protein
MGMAKQQFSERHTDSVAVMAIVCEMAVADGWKNLDECQQKNPDKVEFYMRLADAALRAMKRIDTSTKQMLH